MTRLMGLSLGAGQRFAGVKEPGVDSRNRLIEAMVRKGLSAREVDEACGFGRKARYTDGLISPRRGGPEKAELGKIRKVLEVLDCVDLLGSSVDHRRSRISWDQISEGESALGHFGKPLLKAKNWWAFTRCVEGFIVPPEMNRWYCSTKFQESEWDDDEIDEELERKKVVDEDLRGQMRQSGVIHNTVVPESVFHDAATVCQAWVGDTAERLNGEVGEGTFVTLIPDEHWKWASGVIGQKTGLGSPCTLEVVDESIAVWYPTCTGQFMVSDNPQQAKCFQEAITSVLGFISSDKKYTVDRLTKIALAKKSIRR